MTYEIIQLSPKTKDITGYYFGDLLTLYPVSISKHGMVKWLCVCACGRESIVERGHLSTGHTKSCGCKRLNGKPRKTHGSCKTPEYKTWCSIKYRVYSESCKEYKYYGGRGIVMDKRWVNSFENFYADMGDKPSPNHSIDRIDNDGDYTPENCRWATRKEQSRNKSSSRMLTFRGETRCIAEWSDITGLTQGCIHSRIDSYGWSVRDALTTKKYGKKTTIIKECEEL